MLGAASDPRTRSGTSTDSCARGCPRLPPTTPTCGWFGRCRRDGDGCAGRQGRRHRGRHGVSVRTVQRLFSEYVGVGPKWVLQRYRLHEALAQLHAGADTDWARFALGLGYYDQAHFVRDFRALVGRTPVAVRARAPD